jgi:hypothetical protein
MKDQINREYLEQHAEEAGQDIANQINSVYGPLWRHRLDLAKLIVSLNSIIIVGTVTFSGSIIQASGVRGTGYLLELSWVFFFLSLVAALGSLWTHAELLSFQARWVNTMPKLRERFDALDSQSPRLVDEILGIVGEESNKALQPSGTADIWSKRLLNSSILFFVFGLFSFLLFGADQL